MFSIFLAGAFLICFIFGSFYRARWERGVHTSIKFDESFTYAGENTSITEVIENRKKMPVAVLEVGFHCKKELDFGSATNTNVSDFIYKRDIFTVMGRQRITRRINLICRKRGFYEINEADLTAYSPLFKKSYRKSIPCNTSLYVYPAIADISDILTSCRRMTGLIQCSRSLIEDPFTFRSIREYTLTDPMKYINWKASAKTGALMVNTYDSVMTRKAMIYLDLEDNVVLRSPELIEDGISVAASVARSLLLENMEVGIVTNAGECVRMEPVSGREQLHSIEIMLAQTDVLGKIRPYGDILSDAPEDTVIVFVSKNYLSAKEAVCRFVDEQSKLQRPSLMGLWVIPVYAGDRSRSDSIPMAINGIEIIKREVGRS